MQYNPIQCSWDIMISLMYRVNNLRVNLVNFAAKSARIYYLYVTTHLHITTLLGYSSINTEVKSKRCCRPSVANLQRKK